LQAHAPEPVDELPLPPGSPFGTVVIEEAGCTLCLSCVGACPTGAMIDNPDAPMLRFNEEACIQCGLCRNTCPESVIKLEARLSFLDEARSPRVLKEEEPFECVRCGKPFGTKSSVERILERLEGHSMFADNPDGLDRIRMCDDCRISSEFDQQDTKAFGARAVPRTTDDYFAGRVTDDDDDDGEN
jgi:ferredoxin